MNATRSNRIIGTSIAGVGMALTMFAGTALGACPQDGEKTAGKVQPAARTSQTCCTIACGDAATCTPPAGSQIARKQVTRQRRVIIRGGPDGIRLGDASFGDLEFDGDNIVLVGPEGKKRQVIRRIKRGGDGATFRTEIRIVGPRGVVKQFSFIGDDLDGQSRRFGPLSLRALGDGFSGFGDRSFVFDVQPEDGDEFWFVPDDDDSAFSRTDSRLFFTQQTDDDTITIEIRNGKVTAKINGKKVPQSRIRREGGKVSIFNEDGEVVATVPVAMGGGGFVVGEPDLSFLGNLLRQPEAPPVMLGIRMSLVDDDTADALDLDEGEGILIVGVIDDLPAEEAGLQEHDVILRIRGVGVATQEKLHNVLLKKEPGDEITFKIARGDGVMEIEVELEAYDAGDLGIQMRDFAQPEAFRFRVPGPGGNYDEETEQELIKRYYNRLKGFDFDEEAMKEVSEAIEEAMEGMREGLPKFNYRMWRSPADNEWTILHGEDPEHVFVLAPYRGAGDSDIKKELGELKKQLADVQRQRNELADELAEIKALLKKLAGRSDRD